MWVHVKEKFILRYTARKAFVLSASLHFPRAGIWVFLYGGVTFHVTEWNR